MYHNPTLYLVVNQETANLLVEVCTRAVFGFADPMRVLILGRTCTRQLMHNKNCSKGFLRNRSRTCHTPTRRRAASDTTDFQPATLHKSSPRHWVVAQFLSSSLSPPAHSSERCVGVSVEAFVLLVCRQGKGSLSSVIKMRMHHCRRHHHCRPQKQ